MRWIHTALGAILAAAALAGAASAQTVGIGATKAGAVSQITATISKAVSEHAPGVQMRKQTMGGTQQYIPVVNAGELEFGISNIPQFSMAFEGRLGPVQRQQVRQSAPRLHDHEVHG